MSMLSKFVTVLCVLLSSLLLASPARADTTTFSILSIGIQAPNTAPAPNGPFLPQVQQGATEWLTIYVNFQTLPASCQVSVTFVIKDSAGNSQPTSANTYACPGSGVVEEFYLQIPPPSLAGGTYTLIGSVSVTDQSGSAVTQSSQSGFTVLGAPATATPTPTATLTPRPTPTPTATNAPISISFSVLAARVEPPNAKPDWELVKPPSPRVAPKKAEEFAIYLLVKTFQAPPNYQFFATYALSSGGKTVWSYRTDFRFQAGTHAGDTLRIWIEPTKLPVGPGSYQLTGQLTINGTTKTASTAFSVGKPLAPKSLSFQLQPLRFLDAQTQREGPLHVGAKFFVAVSWVTQGARGSAPVTITVTYNDVSTHRAITSADVYRLSTTNGAHAYQASFLAPRHDVLVAVGLTIGGHTKSTARLLKITT